MEEKEGKWSMGKRSHPCVEQNTERASVFKAHASASAQLYSTHHTFGMCATETIQQTCKCTCCEDAGVTDATKQRRRKTKETQTAKAKRECSY